MKPAPFAHTFALYCGLSAPRKALVAAMIEALPKGRNLYHHWHPMHLPTGDCRECIAECITVVKAKKLTGGK